jgi:hypothetical protein
MLFGSKAVVKECLELGLGLTLVVVATPFVFTGMLMDKIENIVKLVKQMKSSDLD